MCTNMLMYTNIKFFLENKKCLIDLFNELENTKKEEDIINIYLLLISLAVNSGVYRVIRRVPLNKSDFYNKFVRNCYPHTEIRVETHTFLHFKLWLLTLFLLEKLKCGFIVDF